MSDNEMSYDEWEAIFEMELEYMDIVTKKIKESFENERNKKLASIKIVQPTIFDINKPSEKNTHKKHMRVSVA